MKNSIKKLRDFYLLDGKLLYVSQDFIGFDPLISKGLSYERPEKTGFKVKSEKFEMGNSLFNAILTFFIDWGPLRGYKRVEILKNGSNIIQYEHGGKGHGSNYSEGNYFHLKKKDAFLLKDGYALRDAATDKIYSDLINDQDYVFWFKNIVIPAKNKLWPLDGRILYSGRIYSRAEIEPLRQLQWEAQVNFNNHHINIKKTAVPFCWLTLCRTADNYEEFKRNDDEGFTALDSVEFIFN